MTGEHKIKASLLKAEFGQNKTIIFGKSDPKFLQSPKSKHAHFDRKICNRCNSDLTQPADRAFDELHKGLLERYSKGSELTQYDGRPTIDNWPNIEANCFRYFAKLLCCFLVEVDGPRPKSLAKFALGQSDRNIVFLRITKDLEYQTALETYGATGFAGHGGLMALFDSDNRWIKSMNSSLSAGGIKYEFWVDLNLPLSIQLALKFPRFVGLARSSIINQAPVANL